VTAPVVTVGSTDSIDAAAALMRDRSVRRLPVVDAGDLVGVVTTTTLAHSVSRLRDAVLRARRGTGRE
jgi:CBS domain-containing protein